MNINKDTTNLIKKLSRKHPEIINLIREIYLDSELIDFDPNDYLEEISEIITSRVKRMSKKELLEYYFECLDADPNLLPKKVIKSLTKKEKEILDIE